MNHLKDKKILILGARGMLGFALSKVMADLDLVLWDKDDLDITNAKQVKNKITELKPDIIINCAAYTNVDKAETDFTNAMKINGDALIALAQTAKEIDAVIVHISTDYVFDGLRSDGYEESAFELAPWSVYGQTKLAGEQKLVSNTDKYYLIRSSWLYGPNGKNFVDRIIELGKEKDELKIVNDQFGRPTYTLDLAKQILYVLENQPEFGIYHATNNSQKGGITWYEFAQKIIELAGLSTKINPCATEEYPLPAKRPKHSVLLNTKLPQMRDWQEALKEYLTTKQQTT